MPHLKPKNEFYINGILDSLPQELFDKLYWGPETMHYCKDPNIRKMNLDDCVPHILEIAKHTASNGVLWYQFRCGACLQELSGNPIKHNLLGRLLSLGINLINRTEEYLDKARQIRNEIWEFEKEKKQKSKRKKMKKELKKNLNLKSK